MYAGLLGGADEGWSAVPRVGGQRRGVHGPAPPRTQHTVTLSPDYSGAGQPQGGGHRRQGQGQDRTR